VIAVYKGNSPPQKMPASVINNKDRIILQKWTHKGLAASIEKARGKNK
jgi:hypothetical protein